MIKVLNVKNEIRNDNENFKGDLYPYISIYINIKLLIKEADSS
jgi:hypothetical protein